MSGTIEQYEKYVMPTYGRQPVVFVRGNGCFLYDEEGEAYLDFVAGLSINNLGHCHPAVVKAAQAQMAELINTCNLYYTKPGGELAELLSKSQPGRQRVFSNAAPRANECAIKLARKYGHDIGGADKHRIITLRMVSWPHHGGPVRHGPAGKSRRRSSRWCRASCTCRLTILMR